MSEKDRIDKILQMEQLTSAQFAVEIGIQTSTLSHIMNNRNKPSLDVLKKILHKYPQISSDWLILGSGPMFRNELKSQSLSLFDDFDSNNSKSEIYTEKIDIKENVQNSGKENEVLKSEDPVQQSSVKSEEAPVYTSTPTKKDLGSENFVQPNPKTVKKIILYYSDNTFQEFESK